MKKLFLKQNIKEVQTMKKLLLNLVFAGLLFALVKFLQNADISLIEALLSFGIGALALWVAFYFTSSLNK